MQGILFKEISHLAAEYISFKLFLIKRSGSLYIQQNKTICAILVECIMRNNSVKLF